MAFSLESARFQNQLKLIGAQFRSHCAGADVGVSAWNYHNKSATLNDSIDLRCLV